MKSCFLTDKFTKTGAMSWTQGRRSGGGASQLEPVGPGANHNVNPNLGDVAPAHIGFVGTCIPILANSEPTQGLKPGLRKILTADAVTTPAMGCLCCGTMAMDRETHGAE